MGYSMSWVAVKGDAKAVYATLNLRSTGKREEVPESEFATVQLPNGRTLVVFDHKELKDEQLAAVSCVGETIYCFVEEHVMVADASLWRDGNQVWRVIHDAQQSADHLSADGALPPSFAPTRDKYFAEQQQGEADYIFEIPVELAREFGGYRHDAIFQSDDNEPFEVLESIKKKKWWSLS